MRRQKGWDEAVDWRGWLESWEAQQEGYVPEREDRFQAMFDATEQLLGSKGEKFVALDLASGPGSLSRRLLDRFPAARCVAVDYDPVLLNVGRGALGDRGGRLQWVEANLRDRLWTTQLARSTREETFDVVLSTTALHWLPVSELVALYSDLAALIRPGGAFLNGDHLSFPPYLPTISRVTQGMRDKRQRVAFANGDAKDWASWWEGISREPSVEQMLPEREARFEGRARDEETPIEALHEAALYNAGFSEVASIWQWDSNRVLMAVR